VHFLRANSCAIRLRAHPRGDPLPQGGLLLSSDPRRSARFRDEYVRLHGGAVEELAPSGSIRSRRQCRWTFRTDSRLHDARLKSLLWTEVQHRGHRQRFSAEILFQSGLKWDPQERRHFPTVVRRLYRAIFETLQDAASTRGFLRSPRAIRLLVRTPGRVPGIVTSLTPSMAWRVPRCRRVGTGLAFCQPLDIFCEACPCVTRTVPRPLGPSACESLRPVAVTASWFRDACRERARDETRAPVGSAIRSDGAVEAEFEGSGRGGRTARRVVRTGPPSAARVYAGSLTIDGSDDRRSPVPFLYVPVPM